MRRRRVAGLLLGGAAAVAAGVALTFAGCPSFGERASGERLARMQKSPQWRDDRFENPQPMWNDMSRALVHGFSGVPAGARRCPAARWGIPPGRIVELDWWQSTRVGALALTLVPARHASGRVQPRSDRTLWGGFALVGERHRVYYSGDTGLFEAMREIGRRFGPFDLALVESGQYDAAWPDWHLGPEQAVLSAQRVHAKALMPVHWGLFRLAPHGWTEPVERVLAAARCTDVPVITPRPGHPFEPTALRPGDSTRWWPDARWSSATQTPIVATLDGVDAHRVALPPCPASAAAQSVSER